MLQSENVKTFDIEEVLEKQRQERGFQPLCLEKELLIKRIMQGGYSGHFLAKAFLSSYQMDTPFEENLMGIMKLDCEGQRLFHQILHIRLIDGWTDSEYVILCRQIKEICEI